MEELTPLTLEDLKGKREDLFVAAAALLRLVGKQDWLDETQIIESVVSKPVISALVLEVINSIRMKRSPDFSGVFMELFSLRLAEVQAAAAAARVVA